ncbi:MAG: protein-glutamate O-methyltransferase CheR [Terracidiphilus sp.]
MTDALAVADYACLREVVLRESHNVLDPSCDFLFETRLAGVLRANGMSRLHELVQRVRAGCDQELERAIAEAMTTRETSFFRDHRAFDLLRHELVPAMAEARRSCRTLRLWSAACSTGQEAYSLAILLREHFGAETAWSLRIDGTDIATEAIERASRGVYHRIEMNRGLEPRHLALYFDLAGEQWQAGKGIRSLCRFQRLDLCRAPLMLRERFDMILLRNVMLYFTHETRRALLANVHRLLAPDGILLLGSAEQTAESPLWAATLAGGACFYRPL